MKTIRYGEQAARNDEVGVFRVLQQCGASFRAVQDTAGEGYKIACAHLWYMVWHTRACIYCGVGPEMVCSITLPWSVAFRCMLT